MTSPHSADKLKVVVRVRPLSDQEEQHSGGQSCLALAGGRTIVLSDPSFEGTFDNVLGVSSTQNDVYRVAGESIVESCLGGYNSSILAFGPTGSGKTYTLAGALARGEDGQLAKQCGLALRLFQRLFQRISEEELSKGTGKLRFSVKCSYLELQEDEAIIDLIDPTATGLQIRDGDLRRGVFVDGLSEREVLNVDDVLLLLQHGSANRALPGTQLSHQSGRGHTVFTSIIEAQESAENGIVNIRFSKLSIVDLAGSEHTGMGSSTGGRLTIGQSSSRSLATLGQVVAALVERQKRPSTHVPYRDSRLTFLLQDALGGNCQTYLFANVSPSPDCAQQTLSTLRFAAAAMKVQNKAIANTDARGDMRALQLENARLVRMLWEARAVSGAAPAPASKQLRSSLTDTAKVAEAARVAEQELRISNLKEQLRQAELAVAEGDVIMLKLQAEGSAARKAMFDAQAEVSQLEADKALLLSEIEGLKGGAHNMAAAQAEASRLAKLNMQLHSELENLQGKLQEAVGGQAEASRLAKLNSHLHCELEALRGELQGSSGLKAEASRVAKLNSQLQSEIEGLRAELQQAQESSRQDKEALRHLQLQLDERNADVAAAAVDMAALRVDLMGAKRQVALLQLDFQKELTRREALSAVQRSKEELEQQVAQMQQIIQQLQCQLQEREVRPGTPPSPPKRGPLPLESDESEGRSWSIPASRARSGFSSRQPVILEEVDSTAAALAVHQAALSAAGLPAAPAAAATAVYHAHRQQQQRAVHGEEEEEEAAQSLVQLWEAMAVPSDDPAASGRSTSRTASIAPSEAELAGQPGAKQQQQEAEMERLQPLQPLQLPRGAQEGGSDAGGTSPASGSGSCVGTPPAQPQRQQQQQPQQPDAAEPGLPAAEEAGAAPAEPAAQLAAASAQAAAAAAGGLEPGENCHPQPSPPKAQLTAEQQQQQQQQQVQRQSAPAGYAASPAAVRPLQQVHQKPAWQQRRAQEAAQLLVQRRESEEQVRLAVQREVAAASQRAGRRAQQQQEQVEVAQAALQAARRRLQEAARARAAAESAVACLAAQLHDVTEREAEVLSSPSDDPSVEAAEGPAENAGPQRSMRLPGGIGLAARDAGADDQWFDDDDYWFGDGGQGGGGSSGGGGGSTGDGGEGAAAAPDESASAAAAEAAATAAAAATDQGPQQQPSSGAQGVGPVGFVKIMLVVAPPGKEASCRNVDVEGAIMDKLRKLDWAAATRLKLPAPTKAASLATGRLSAAAAKCASRLRVLCRVPSLRRSSPSMAARIVL